MIKNSTRIFFIATGVLDLFSLFRTFPTARLLVSNFHLDLIWTLHLLLIVSLLFSGVLLILNKKSGLIIYYFQFPLKLAFMILTFGFLLSFIHLPSFSHKILLGFIIGLETVRLFGSVMLQRR